MTEHSKEDPYAVSSDSDDDRQGHPPKITIEKRAADLGSLKEALASEKDMPKDETRIEEIRELKAAVGTDLDVLRQDFESGKVGGITFEPKINQDLDIIIDKKQYSQFKDKFETMTDGREQEVKEKRGQLELEMHDSQWENLSIVKGKFENLQNNKEIVRHQVDIQRSDADKQRVLRTFIKNDNTVEQVPKDCTICGMIVYPVEKVFANKAIYHKNCFRCTKCAKCLLATNYNSHQGQLMCKVHLLEVFHPELAKNMDPDQTEEDDHGLLNDDANFDDDNDYAVVSHPKVLNSNVVRSALKSSDDLSAISSLREKKGNWESSVQESQKTEKLTTLDREMFPAGRVKTQTNKIVEGEQSDEIYDDDDDDDDDEIEELGRDPTVIRENKRRRKERLHFDQVDDLKHKWMTGEIDKIPELNGDWTAELDQLKKGLTVKERFKECTEEADDWDSGLEKETVDTSWPFSDQEQPMLAFLSFLRKRYVSISSTPSTSPPSPRVHIVSSEARKAFLDGAAFDHRPVQKTVKDDVQFTGSKRVTLIRTHRPICTELGSFKERFEHPQNDDTSAERTIVDVHCAELANIKAAFEKGSTDEGDMTIEQRSDRKQKDITEEFDRYKQARRKQELRDEREHQDGGEKPDDSDEVLDIRTNTEMGSIKERFETGVMYRNDDHKTEQHDLFEMKLTGKARQKFIQIDADGLAPIRPTMQNKSHLGKWSKGKEVSVPEPINKRSLDQVDLVDDDDGSFEVKVLMDKFKKFEQDQEIDACDKKQKPQKRFTPPPEGYRSEFESSVGERDPNVVMCGLQSSDLEGLASVEARELKARFEEGTDEHPAETPDEKRKRLEEEFRKYRELKKEHDRNRLEEEIPEEKPGREKPQVVAEHASRMTAKWEKIHKKETKKAQKGQMSAKYTPCAVICFVCSRKVYMAERLECDGRTCHRMCFRCKVCSINLRIENYNRGPDGIYCTNHHKERFNDMTRPSFIYETSQQFVCSA